MEILNLEGNLNCVTGFRVTAILLNGWILPFGGASAVEGLLSTGPTPSSFPVHTTQFQIRPQGGGLVQGVTKLITILLTFVTLNKNYVD